MTAASHALRAQDIVQRVFLPYQLRWFRDQSRMRLGEKSRQIGWTWMNAFEDAINGVGTDKSPNTYFMAGDSEAAKAYIDDCANWLDDLKVAANRFTDDWFDAQTELKHKVQCIEFPNGARLEAMSSNPRRLRGRRGNVKLDEFAFHDNPEELLRAATPVTTWGYRLAIWSTHNGLGRVFNRLCEMANRRAEGKPRKGDMKFSLHRVTLLDAVADGLVERFNAATGQSLTSEQYIEQRREGCLTQDDFEQEYMCNASAESMAWLPYDLIDACMRDTIFDLSRPDLVEGRVSPRTEDLGEFLAAIRALSAGASQVVAGVDFGRRHDRFVIWVRGQFGEQWKTIGLLWWRGKPWAAMKHAIAQTMELRTSNSNQYVVLRMCLDATGMGDEPSEWAEQTYRHRAEGVVFTLDSKQNMAVLVRSALEDKREIIPWDDVVRDDLHSVIKEISPSGKPRFIGERTAEGHADLFWGLGLSMHAQSNALRLGRAVTVTGGSI